MSTIINERWRDLPGFEGLYQVSDQGRVRRLPAIVIRRGHQMKTPGKMLKCPPDKNGYKRFGACKKGKVTYFWVHQAVLLVFVGPRPKGFDSRHLNGNSMDNRLANLSYGSRKQNIEDAKTHGTFPLYENRPGAILDRKKVIDIVTSNETAKIIAAKYNVTAGYIAHIRKGRTWGDITEGKRKKSYRKKICKLSIEQVKEIRKSNGSYRSLAKIFSVDKSTIRNIKTGKTWKDVA